MNPVRGGRSRLAGVGYDPCSGSGLITSSVVDGAAVYPACCVLKFRCHFVAYKVLQSIGFVAGLGAVLRIRCADKLLIKHESVLQL